MTKQMNYQLRLTNDSNRINNHLKRCYDDCNWGENFKSFKNENLNFINNCNGKLLEFEDEIGGSFIYDIQKFNSVAIGCLWIEKNKRGKKLSDIFFNHIFKNINERIYFFCLEHLVEFYKRKNFKEIFLNENNCYLMSNYQISNEMNDYIF